jgi:hypothetical protein
MSVLAGQSCIGHVVSRGRDGFEAFDADDISLGNFDNLPAAAAAIARQISQLVANKGPEIGLP